MFKKVIVGLQMLFVAFGATVLVPLLTGQDSNGLGLTPSIALFTAGVGTLIFHGITGLKLPVFLGSSFAYIAVIAESNRLFGFPATLSGLMAAGFLKVIFSFVIRFKGRDFIKKILPSTVVGPVIMVIGLSLAPVAINMVTSVPAGSNATLTNNLIIALTSLSVTIILSVFGKGFFRLTPILFGIISGYTVAFFLGYINFDTVSTANWVSVPRFTLPSFSWQAILLIFPVAIAPAIEHIGDVMVISSVVEKDFTKDPGLHKTLLGDGVATIVSSCYGGTPNTTYSEVTGAVALTKMKDPVVMLFAAVFAIILAFAGKLEGVLKSIPAPVMGGIMILLFGTIAAIGIKNMVESNVNLTSNRNLVIVAIILVVGIGGSAAGYPGIGISAILGVILNLVIPQEKNSEILDSGKSEFNDI